MPIYTYECEAGHRFEVEQGINDEPLGVCTEVEWVGGPRKSWAGGQAHGVCGKPCRRILVPGTGVVLKGSCWEKDGYSRGSD